MSASIPLSLRQLVAPAFVANFACMGLVAVCGVLMHVVIGSVWGSAALGVFNQVLGAYLLASQFACAGLQNATLRFTAANPNSAPEIATAGLLLCCATAFVAAVVFWLSRHAVGELLDSPATAQGMAWAVPGLFLFAINKVVIAILNGLNRMIWYAALQALRFVTIVALVGLAALWNLDGEMLPLALTGAEIVVSLTCAVAFVRPARIRNPGARLIRDLFAFGIKSLPATSLTEINQRADVLILALFATDAEVGVYSLASTIVEGFVQVLVVLRALFTPSLVGVLERSPSEAASAVKRVRNLSYAAAIAASAVALIAYPFFLSLSGLDRNFAASFPIFAVLQIGMAMASGYIVLGTLLMLGNRPADQSFYVAAAVAINVAANFLLAPAYGALGAAYATAISAVLASLLLHWTVRRRLAVPI